MKLPHRRRFLQLAAVAAAVPAVPRIARALDYPMRPVRIIVGVPAGTAPNFFARLIGEWLSERLGQHFVIESRPGAGTNIATEAVVRAPPDGYTLLLVTTLNMINASPYQSLNFNFIRDIAPVASISGSPFVMVVNPSFPAKTVPEFIAYAKANPGKINMVSTGTGNLTHLAGELFKMMAGVDMLHVPESGDAPATADILSGRAQVYFTAIVTSIELIRAGKLRSLAVATAARQEVLPGVPTVGESVPGYEVSGVLGIGVPKNTPAEIIEKLNKEINAGLADPKMKAQLADLGGTPFAGSPGDFSKLIADETEKWAKVIKFTGIKTE